MRGSLWSIDTVDGDAQSFDGYGHTDFATGPYRGYFEQFHITQGIHLFRLQGMGEEDFALTAGDHAPEGLMILGCILEGDGCIDSPGNDIEHFRQSGRFYSFTPFGRSVSYRVKAGRRWTGVSLKIDADVLDRVSHDVVPSQVKKALAPNGAPHLDAQSLPSHITRVASELSRPIYTGPLADLHREAKVLELLALQLDFLSDSPANPRQLTAREIVRVRDARDRLLSDLKETPQLHALAHGVGLTPKRLNQGFRELYGTTVFEMLRDMRLDAAREMLNQVPELPLKQIAWTVGYAQATNFISAYRRRFGVPPGRHKRLGRD